MTNVIDILIEFVLSLEIGLGGKAIGHFENSYLSYHCDKIPDRNNLREGELILAHGSEGLVHNLWLRWFWAHGEADGTWPWERVQQRGSLPQEAEGPHITF